MSLDTLLKEAAAKGMTHLSVWPVPSQDGKKLYWHAQATPSTGHSYVQTNSLDIVEAITEVLKALPKAPKNKKPKFDSVSPPISEIAQRAVTETVSEPAVSPAEPVPGDMDAWLPKT